MYAIRGYYGSGKLWMAVYDERSAQTSIRIYRSDSTMQTLFTVPGQYPKRPIVNWEGEVYLAAYGSKIWILDQAGEKKSEVQLAENGEEPANIIQFQTTADGIYALLDDGRRNNFV